MIMRRRSFIRDIVLLGAAPALLLPRKSQAVVIVQPVAVAGCATLAQDHSGANTAQFNVGSGSSRAYAAGQFAATADRTVCRVDLPLFKSGSPTMDLYISLYSNNAATTPDEPNAIIGSEHATPVNAATISATDPIAGGTWASWTGMSWSITNTTLYFIVVRTSAQDAANFCLWPCFGASTTGAGATDGDAVAPWSNETSRSTGIRLYTA